jgi:hypothetical protein
VRLREVIELDQRCVRGAMNVNGVRLEAQLRAVGEDCLHLVEQDDSWTQAGLLRDSRGEELRHCALGLSERPARKRMGVDFGEAKRLPA